MSKSSITLEDIRVKAFEIGWDDVGVTSASIPEQDIVSYRTWLENNYHADLHYMENQLRCDPQSLLPHAKTALIFVTYYKQEKIPFVAGSGVVASYARGRDYHKVHRKRLKKMICWLEERSGQKDIAKGFSDSTPVLEKALACQAGLGWFGKNTLFIHRKLGTFTLLSGILTTLEFDFAQTKNERLNRCGVCTRCIDACPTQAIVSPFQLDAAKCLSYQLIESKKPIPSAIALANPGYIFGCDICQDVCPHNERKPLSLLPEFQGAMGMGHTIDETTLSTIEQHPENLHGTPLQRRGVNGLRHSFDQLKKE